MKTYPLNHDDGETDHRYSIEKEYHGAAKAAYVLRFCDEWVSVHTFKIEATQAAEIHHEKRMKDLLNGATK